MLTTDQQYILSLLRESFRKVEPKQIIPVDNRVVANIISRNNILLTIYQKLLADFNELLKERYNVAIKQSIVQNYEGELVLKALSDAGLSCIALKGWELRKLYPDPTMRQMADLDILVKSYDFNLIKSVMRKLGFSGGTESSWKHDSFKKKDVHVEMHKRLTDDSNVIQAWEKGIWDRAGIVEGNIHRMSLEDYYIFHFVHLQKDFMNGSLGLRRIVDTWLLQKQSVDMEQVQHWLEKFGMWKFHERMVKLSRVTMGDEPMNADSEVLLIHAFTHGIYGSSKSYKAGRIAAMGGNVRTGKLKSKLAAVFLPYKRMKAQFPILEKWPILLPYCWMKRIIRFLKGDKKKYSRMLDYCDVRPEDYEEMKRFFEAGGVMS